MKGKTYAILLLVIIALLLSYLLLNYGKYKDIDIPDTNNIIITNGNNGDSIDLSKHNNIELMDYIINHFSEARYKREKSSKDYGGYRYSIRFIGKKELSILVMTDVNVTIGDYMYIMDNPIDLEMIKKVFDN